MKIAKAGNFVPFGFFAAGILALLLAGCFNPITVIPPKGEETPVVDEPFTVDVWIGNDTAARSVAGPDSNRIKGDIRNILQLIVIDEDGNIAAFDEVRRKNDAETEAELWIDDITFGKKYYFLLLMGHWNRNMGVPGDYAYTADPPTLLAAGLKDQTVTGNGKVTISMWPVVVDTEFTSGARVVAPAVSAGKPGEAVLLPVDWNVKWTIKRGLSGNGLGDLVRAQNILSSAGETLKVKSMKTMVREGNGPGPWSLASLSGNVITQAIGSYTSGITKIGTKGSVNFKMEYVPFNLAGDGPTNPWTALDGKSAFDLDGTGEPVWIIRNGVNDLAQDGNTDFSNFHYINDGGLVSSSANGNGAVRYEVKADEPDNPGTPGPGDLVIKDGKFEGPSSVTNPKIGFTTDGYADTAGVYYAVVEHGDSPPDYSEYTKSLTPVAVGVHTGKEIAVPFANHKYDIYVILFKNGKVSAPVVINTAGSEGVDWIWGDKPYVSYYVKSNGDDGNTGTKDNPLETVQKALEKLAAAYTADASWPGKGTGEEVPGGIIILDTVPVAQEIGIDGSVGYPSIVLCDDPEPDVGDPEGKLQATAAISGTDKSLLRLTKGAKVTLSGGLTLAGTGNTADLIRGIFMTGGSTFTMNGGKISGNSTKSYGGGIAVYSNSTFTMNDGEISENVVTGNTANGFGGGIFVTESSTVTINGGKISDNSADFSGGGIYMNNSTVTMNDGVISGNVTVGTGLGTNSGGGIFLTGSSTGSSTFTMDGGVISGNSAAISGGGVYLFTGTFIMTRGVISGNVASSSGGGVNVAASNSKFEKTGGTIYGYDSADPNSNVVKNSLDAIQINQGHAAYINSSHRKETTVGPNAQLFYNYPDDISGW